MYCTYTTSSEGDIPTAANSVQTAREGEKNSDWEESQYKEEGIETYQETKPHQLQNESSLK